MFARTFRLLGLLAGVGAGLGGCVDGYGYSGVDVGYGSGGYYDPYGAGYGLAGYGGGYAPSYFGWYGDYYYPGTGSYVYDRYRRRQPWNDGQRRYWEGRRGGYRDGQPRDNWADFRRDNRPDRRDYRGDGRRFPQAGRDGAIDRGPGQPGRAQVQRGDRGEGRGAWRGGRPENRVMPQGDRSGGRAFRGGGGPGPRGGGRPPRNIP